MSSSPSYRKSIKPIILPYQIKITNLATYVDFRKKGHKILHTFKVSYPKNPDYSPLEIDKHMISRLRFLLKRIKAIQALDLNRCTLRSECLSAENVAYLTKKARRVKSLGISDYWKSIRGFYIQPRVWLKYLRDLKQLEYKLVMEFFPLSWENTKRFDKSVKIFLLQMRRHKKMDAVSISLPYSNALFLGPFVQFHLYPPSLKKLSLHGGNNFYQNWVNPHKLNIKLSHMKNLETLSINIAREDSLITSLLPQIMTHSTLKSLDLVIPVNKINLPETLKATKGLKQLRLNLNPSLGQLATISKLFDLKSLDQVTLMVNLDNQSPLSILINFISQLTDLKHLKINAFHYSKPRDRNCLKQLIDQLSELRALKSLKLTFITYANITKEDFFTDVTPSLKVLFMKLKSLETFWLVSNQFDASQVFINLIESLEALAPNLRNLRIDVGEYTPEQYDLCLISKFIQNLRNIKVLKLCSIKMPIKRLPVEVLNSISSLNCLKKLALCEFDVAISKNSFLKLIDNVLANQKTSNSTPKKVYIKNTSWQM